MTDGPSEHRVPSPETLASRRDRWADEGEEDPTYAEFHSEASGWPEARQAAKERDGYQCVICGLSEQEQAGRDDLWGAGLHGHHIRPAATFEQPEEAHDLSNLATLCAECHRKADAGDISRDRLRMAIS